jgi:hypothetical protein
MGELVVCSKSLGREGAEVIRQERETTAVCRKAWITPVLNFVRSRVRLTRVFYLWSMLPARGGSGELFANRRECRETDKWSGVEPHEIRPQAGSDLEAVRAGIGTGLRAIHSDVLREQVPDRIAELLTQLDQQKADTANLR